MLLCLILHRVRRQSIIPPTSPVPSHSPWAHQRQRPAHEQKDYSEKPFQPELSFASQLLPLKSTTIIPFSLAPFLKGWTVLSPPCRNSSLYFSWHWITEAWPAFSSQLEMGLSLVPLAWDETSSLNQIIGFRANKWKCSLQKQNKTENCESLS